MNVLNMAMAFTIAKYQTSIFKNIVVNYCCPIKLDDRKKSWLER